MKRIIFSIIVSLSLSQVAYSAGQSKSGNSQAGSVYIIGKGIVKKSPVCDLVDPVQVYERLAQITNPKYICFTDGAEYFTHVARAGDNTVEIEINLEDNFDGTWYGSVFEYKPEATNALPDAIYRYDLTLEQVQACRAAFEPPFVCIAP